VAAKGLRTVSSNGQNGWNEYSKLVLKEIESLADGIDNINTQIQDIKEDITKIKVREDRIGEIKVWKEKIDDVCSPPQLKELSEQVSDLSQFKTRAITIFAVVQFLMAAVMWATKMFEAG